LRDQKGPVDFNEVKKTKSDAGNESWGNPRKKWTSILSTLITEMEGE